MKFVKMTYKIAHAAATDAANRRMRKEGRKRWNREDYEEAGRTLEQLFPARLEHLN